MQRMFWTTAELQQHGRSRRWVSDAVQDGGLLPLRKGHYFLPGAPPDAVRAARVGGVATASTAARILGIWAPPDGRLHVAVPPTAARLRDPDLADRPLQPDGRVLVHWSRALPVRATLATRVAPILLVLEHALLTLPPEFAVAVLDSALHLRHLRSSDLAPLRDRLPGHLMTVVGMVDGRCESGIESIVRYLLQLAGLPVQVQVWIAEVGRVDLLVAGRLIVEVDGREWHDGADAFDRDRARDTAATLARYRTLRFSYRQVMQDPASVVAAVFAALAQ